MVGGGGGRDGGFTVTASFRLGGLSLDIDLGCCCGCSSHVKE